MRSRPSPSSLARTLAVCSILASLVVACDSSDGDRKPSGRGDGGPDSSAGGSGAGGGKSSGGAGGKGQGGAGGTELDSSAGGGTGGANPADGGDAGQTEITGPYVDCENGAYRGDGGNGDAANPFKTIAQAIEYASPGQAVFILDGRCDDTTQPTFGEVNGRIDVPDGVSIRAVHPGTVTFVGMESGLRARGLRFLGSGEVIGIRFEGFGEAIEASTGTLKLKGVTFDDIWQGRPLALSGDVEAIVEPGDVTNYIGENQHGFAALSGSAKLTMLGGSLSGATDSGLSGDSLFTAMDSAELVFDGFTAKASRMNGIAASGSARVVVKNGTLFEDVGANACCNQSTAILSGSATFELLDSTFDRSNGSGITCSTGTPTVTVRNASVTNSKGPGFSAAIYSNCRPTLTLEEARINRNYQGVFLNYGGTIRITDSEIDDNGSSPCAGAQDGLHVNDPAQPHDVRVRGTSIQRNCGHGVRLNGAAASSFDLGRGSSPGGNTIAGNSRATGFYNLTIDAEPHALTVYAAGNTWDPGIQGAAPANSTTPPPGQYAVESGSVRDVVGAVLGQNHAIRGGGAATTRLRLAENP